MFLQLYEIIMVMFAGKTFLGWPFKGAQDRQRKAYDKTAKEHQFRVGDRVMIHMPSAITGKSWKLAQPFHGPFRVLSVTPTNVEARLVDDPDAKSIFVAVNRVWPCSSSLPDASWTGTAKRRKPRKSETQTETKIDGTSRAGPVTRLMTSSS